jgi:hypothetical protein
MSPKLSLTISAAQLAGLLAEPRLQVAQALAAARQRGIPLRRSEVGVVAGLEEWRPDRRLSPSGVSLVGAVLLAMQPEPRDHEDPTAAAARALGVSLAWVEGAEAGWAGELMDVARLAALDADLYLDGYEVGQHLQGDFGYGR